VACYGSYNVIYCSVTALCLVVKFCEISTSSQISQCNRTAHDELCTLITMCFLFLAIMRTVAEAVVERTITHMLFSFFSTNRAFY